MKTNVLFKNDPYLKIKGKVWNFYNEVTEDRPASKKDRVDGPRGRVGVKSKKRVIGSEIPPKP